MPWEDTEPSAEGQLELEEAGPAWERALRAQKKRQSSLIPLGVKCLMRPRPRWGDLPWPQGRNLWLSPSLETTGAILRLCSPTFPVPWLRPPWGLWRLAGIS